MSRWYRLELLSAQAAGRLNGLIEDQRDRQGIIYIGNGTRFFAAESVTEIPAPGRKPRGAAGSPPAYRVEVPGVQPADHLGQLIDDQRHRHGMIYIGNGTGLLTAENVTEIPAPGREPEEPELG